MPKKKKKIDNSDFQLAILLEDLDRIDPIMRQRTFKDRLNLSEPVKVREGIALAFSCNLNDAATICDIIRSEDRKAGDYPTRIYLRSSSTNWERTPNNAVFTVRVKGSIFLNPSLFCCPIEQAPPEVTRVTFGSNNVAK